MDSVLQTNCTVLLVFIYVGKVLILINTASFYQVKHRQKDLQRLCKIYEQLEVDLRVNVSILHLQDLGNLIRYVKDIERHVLLEI